MSVQKANFSEVWKIYRRLWRDWLCSHRRRLLLTLFLMLIISFTSGGYAKFIQIIIDAFEAQQINVIYWGPGGVILLTFSKSIAQYLHIILQNKILNRVAFDMQNKMFSSLLATDLSGLLAESPAALASRFASDIILVRDVTGVIFTAVSALLTLAVILIVMLSIDWVMTLGLISVFALVVVPISIFSSKIRLISLNTQRQIAIMLSKIIEDLSGIRMIRTYRLEKRMKARAKAMFQRLYHLNVSLSKLQGAVSPLLEIMLGIAMGIVLFMFARRLETGAIDIAGFIGLVTALAVATTPSRLLGHAYSNALQGMAALERVFELYDAHNKINDGGFSYAVGTRARGNVCFQGVSFVYPDGHKALKEIDLEIQAGKTVAFVGRSGAGKSTVFNLLPRLFDPSEGQIKLDGRPLPEFALAALRDQFSVVGQDSFLLSGTVLENISFGCEGASRAGCIKAAKAAAAHDFIENLPDGYDSYIESAHASFSGGERQRLSIARAILRDAPILLLDEPTSALDATSEAEIRTALDRLSEGRTTLIIAHRLATILDADQIVVMEQGRLVDQGTHHELLERGGIYNSFYQLQFNGNGVIVSK